MKQLVEYIVTSLVTEKNEVFVEEIAEENETTIVVKVAEADMGKIIGKNGKIAQAIRAIVKTASAGTGIKYIIKIGE